MTILQAQTWASAVGKRFLNFCPTKDPEATPTTPAKAASKPTTKDTLYQRDLK
jgi:hypothetical protein